MSKPKEQPRWWGLVVNGKIEAVQLATEQEIIEEDIFDLAGTVKYWNGGLPVKFGIIPVSVTPDKE